MANSKDLTKKFLEKASEIRAFDLKTSSLELSDKQKNLRVDIIKDEVKALSEKYPNLESPEKEYLEGLKSFYGTKFDYSAFEKGRISLDTPITDLDFTVRAINSLKRCGKDYLGEVIQNNKSEFSKIGLRGAKTLKDIEKVIAKEGYKFGMDIGYVRPDKRK